jgi:hypothetical protein
VKRLAASKLAGGGPIGTGSDTIGPVGLAR